MREPKFCQKYIYETHKKNPVVCDIIQEAHSGGFPLQQMATAAASSAVLKAILPPKTTKVPRTSNTTVCVPVVYGSIAFWLGKKAYEYQTHRWTLYVRGPKGEDLSYAISKVAFHLHPSFAQPIREITSPPFEVTETGWGEFEANIRM